MHEMFDLVEPGFLLMYCLVS